MLTRFQKTVIYITLTLFGLLMVFPFFWSIISSFKPANEIISIPPRFWSENFTLKNYREVITTGKFGRWYLNSIIVASVVTISVCFFSSLAGYSLSKFTYPHKEKFFYFILSTMMVPLQILIIPWYVMFTYFKLNDTYLGLILPGIMSAFGIFMIRQFCDNIPDSIIEAARLDGASEFKIFYKIIFPILKPSLSALAIITFVGNWDAFLWPLIIINNESLKTLPLGLQSFAGQYTVEYHLIMAAANLAVIPSIVIFLILQRQIIRSIAGSGLKG